MSYAEAVKLQDELNNPYGIKHITNKPRVVNTPYYDEIVQGNIPGHVARHIVGIQPAVSLVASDVSELGVLTIPLPSVATAMEIVSSSTQDGVAGTGILQLDVHGLDATGNLLTQTIVMNGITPVAIPTPLLRVNYINATSVGTAGVAVGVIDCRDVATPTTVYSKVTVGNVESRQALFTIPAGKSGYITDWAAGITGKETIIMLTTTADYGMTSCNPGVFRILDEIAMKDSNQQNRFILPLKLPALCDLKIKAIDASGGGGGIAVASFQLYYE